MGSFPNCLQWTKFVNEEHRVYLKIDSPTLEVECFNQKPAIPLLKQFQVSVTEDVNYSRGSFSEDLVMEGWGVQ